MKKESDLERLWKRMLIIGKQIELNLWVGSEIKNNVEESKKSKVKHP